MDDATLSALLATFFEESFEGLDRTEAGLLQLEDATSLEVVADLFRAIHSIKGGAGAFGIDEVTGLAHVMENLLDDIRSGTRATAEMSAALLSGVDHLRRSLDARHGGRPVNTAEHQPVIARLVAARAGVSRTCAYTGARLARSLRAPRAPHAERQRPAAHPVSSRHARLHGRGRGPVPAAAAG